MKSVMVLMGENRGPLATVRSLGKLGIPIYVGASRFLSRSLYSKYTKKRFLYPSAHFGIDQMHKGILKQVKKLKPDVLLTFGSDTTRTVLTHLKEYEKYTKVVPNIGLEKFELLDDKETMIQEAMKVKCPVPKTYFPKNITELKKIAPQLPYPVLIKLRISSGGKGMVKAHNSKQLIKLYQNTINQEKKYQYDPTRPTIQEFIDGERHSVTGVFNKGKLVGNVVFYNHKHYPEYGSPILNETVRNENVRQAMIKMFEDLNWHGPANCQCIYDPRDKKTKLLEINPRLWACTGSTIAAGVNAPYLLYQMALGQDPKPSSKYKINQKYRWILFGELFYLLQNKKKWQNIKDYFNFKNTKSDIDLLDPLPHIIQILDLIINKQIV